MTDLFLSSVLFPLAMGFLVCSLGIVIILGLLVLSSGVAELIGADPDNPLHILLVLLGLLSMCYGVGELCLYFYGLGQQAAEVVPAVMISLV